MSDSVSEPSKKNVLRSISRHLSLKKQRSNTGLSLNSSSPKSTISNQSNKTPLTTPLGGAKMPEFTKTTPLHLFGSYHTILQTPEGTPIRRSRPNPSPLTAINQSIPEPDITSPMEENNAADSHPTDVSLTRSQSQIDLSDSDEEFKNVHPNSLPAGSTVKVERYTHAHSAMLIEAVNDTPSFHASASFLDTQIKQLQQWLLEFQKKTNKVEVELHKLKEPVNEVISHFMPSVTHKSLLAQDYTTLLFGRYTEAESLFWTELFATVKRNASAIENMVRGLKDGVFTVYFEARSEYVDAYEKLKNARKALFLLPPQAMPIAVRDANMHAWKCYRLLVRTSTKLVLAISELESECSLKLLETLSEQYVGVDGGFITYDQSKLTISTELFRLKTFASNLRLSLPQLHNEMRRLRSEALKSVKQMAPSNNVSSYEGSYDTNVDIESAGGSHKEGWLNVNVGRDEWIEYWGFIQNGLFGLLGLTDEKDAVTESNRWVISNTDFEIINDKEKVNVFKLSYTPILSNGNADHTATKSVLLQAMHRIDLAQWEKAFKTNKSLEINKKWALREICAWSPKYLIPILGNEAAPECALVADKISLITKEATSMNWLQYNSTLTSDGAAGFGSNVPVVKPMPTANLHEAVIANGCLNPHGIPNGITANFWGSVGHFSESELLNFAIPSYGNCDIDYPPSYPKGLVIQDLGMRAFSTQLSAEERPENDDFVVLFFRATTYMFGCEVPARLYATGKKLLFYANWNGLVALLSVPIEKVLEIDSSHGVSCSELRITFHNYTAHHDDLPNISESDGDQRRVVRFNLYIDSSALAQRRLDLVLRNRRSRTPLSCEQLIEPLGIINLEYAEALKVKEIKMENEMATHRRAKYESAPKSFGEWLFSESVGERNTLGEEDAFEFGKGMQMKLAQDTFPINADTLFTVIFGPRSTVFLENEQEKILNMITTVEPWVRNGRRLERRIKQTFALTEGSKRELRYNYQRLEHIEPGLFVVTERRCAWEMPGGEQFHLVLKYVVYATPTGSHLQIWARLIWRTKGVSSNTRETVQHFVKVIAQTLAFSIRNVSASVESLEEAKEKYGEVKAVKVVKRKSSSYPDDIKVTRVSTRYITKVILTSPLMHSCENIMYGIRYALTYITGFTSPIFLFILAVAFFSLVCNYKLYIKSSTLYWDSHFKQQETEKFVNEMKLLPPYSPVFRRAIYSHEVNDLLNTSLASKNNSFVETITPNATIHQTGCAKKFESIAELSLLANDFGFNIYKDEPVIRETIERISNLRLDYATKRNDMITLIQMLNQNEVNELQQEFRRWMINESRMCSRVRSVLNNVNESVYEHLSLYCVSCLDETKNLI